MPIPAGLDELLSEYERRELAGTPVTPEDLCRDHPTLLPEVRRCVAALRAVPAADAPADDPPPPVRVTAATEFVGLRPFARGGLGEVLVGWDAALGREVAVKRVRPPLDADPARRGRFLREAAVTGRLEHPGVVPVYALGADEAGRPCYAMRLLRGQTLREVIRAFHAGGGGDAVAFRDLLGRFVAVCQAAGFAHAHGVVHRDIKPENVVTGAFGETILLDWGLAQVGADDPAPGGPAVASLPPFETTAGAVMGTPGYMAPEQAAGGPVGPAADVFSLGATLVTLLTGRGPNDPAGPAPPALLSVARKAMSAGPADRYPTALALADDVTRWLADEPVSAYPDTPVERLRRWGRRNRTLVRIGAAGLVAVSVVSTAAAVLLVRSNDRERSAAALADRRKQDAEASYAKARRAVDEFYVKVSEGKLKGLPGAQPFRKDLLRAALAYYQEFATDRADDPANRADLAATHSKIALIVGEVESAAGAVEWHERAVAAWREVTAEYPDRADYRKELAGALDLYGVHLYLMNRLPDAVAAMAEAVDRLEPLADAEPGSASLATYMSRALLNLSAAQGKWGRYEDAVRTLRRGLAFDERAVRRHPDLYILRRNMTSRWSNLGIDYGELGRTDEAVEAFDRAVRLGGELVAEVAARPDSVGSARDALSAPRSALANTVFNLGVTLMNDDRPDAARPRFLAAAGHARALADSNPTVLHYRELALSAETCAAFTGLLARVPAVDVLPEADRACEAGAKLAAADGSNPDYRARHGHALAVRGAVLARLGRATAAAEAWAAADRCLPADPGGSVTQKQLRGEVAHARAVGRRDLGDAAGAAADVGAYLASGPVPLPPAQVAAARVYAGCAAAVAAAARRRYEDQALDLLRAAVRGGYRRAAALDTDPAFSPLRSRVEWRAATGRAETAPPPRPAPRSP